MSRVFAKPNLSNDWVCPICKQATIKAVVLVPVPGTEDGNITEAQQIHWECALLVGGVAFRSTESKPERTENGKEINHD